MKFYNYSITLKPFSNSYLLKLSEGIIFCLGVCKGCKLHGYISMMLPKAHASYRGSQDIKFSRITWTEDE